MVSKSIHINFPETISRIRKVFQTAVNSVLPQELLRRHIRREDETLVINNKRYELKNNVYVVGFGKAVIGMVPPVEDVLKISGGGSHLQKGIVSVPVGITEQLVNSLSDLPHTTDSIIKSFEGAKNNIPDEDAFATSKKIVSLVQGLRESDLLLVLISGGGSALLPYPLPPLTLDEKTTIIKALSRAGANINELNTVRKALSGSKGGSLAKMTKAKIVSLILSDIINNSLDMIASGPTMPNRDPPEAPIHILHKYSIPVTEKISNVIRSKCEHDRTLEFPHVTNHIIGSNEMALSAIEASVNHDNDYPSLSLVLSSSLHGEAAMVGAKIAELAAKVLSMAHSDHQDDDSLSETLLQDLCIDKEKRNTLLDTVARSREKKCPIWLLFGGETTVTVTGSGLGGRNQEMVLSASITLEKILHKSVFQGEVVIMSGGTDGIDGPTDAAGALTFWISHNSSIESQIQEAKKQHLVPEDFLANNDSYSYFSQLNSGRYLLKPGHTGTNVMDIQILFINPYY